MWVCAYKTRVASTWIDWSLEATLSHIETQTHLLISFFVSVISVTDVTVLDTVITWDFIGCWKVPKNLGPILRRQTYRSRDSPVHDLWGQCYLRQSVHPTYSLPHWVLPPNNKLCDAVRTSHHAKLSLPQTTDDYSREVKEKRKVSDILCPVSTTLTASINLLSKI